METKYLIPLLAAILGAILGQLLSHLFTHQREKKKLEKEVYQNLVAPYLNDVIFYINSETIIRAQHDLEERIDIEQVIKNINQNIKYGNSKLFLALFDYQDSRTYFDGSGMHKDSGILAFLYWYLDFVIYEGIKGVGYENMDTFEFIALIRRTQIKCGIWYLMCRQLNFEESKNKLAILFAQLPNPLANYTVADVSKMIKNDVKLTELTILFKDEYKNIKLEDISYNLF
ncbi:hypothetical protein [Bacillus atrophaeus]|uniref:hypothetical protein n=1 Tax=Bacillus atrophaeus TaxID=1452 RepID=UPI000B92574E|nr:hypothetical protein [Bacillus atrophaeus]ASS70096.1 hypothetical protein BaGK_03515 [Bacillus atrophaeus]